MTIKSDPRELLDHWVDYLAAVLPREIELQTLVDIRRGFFAGAHCLMFEIAKIRELPLDEAERRFNKLDRELIAFAELAKQGLDREHPNHLVLVSGQPHCVCGHSKEHHGRRGRRCQADNCRCQRYDPLADDAIEEEPT